MLGTWPCRQSRRVVGPMVLVRGVVSGFLLCGQKGVGNSLARVAVVFVPAGWSCRSRAGGVLMVIVVVVDRRAVGEEVRTAVKPPPGYSNVQP